jgi:hypothetical protein
MSSWNKDYRRALKDFLLSEARIPEVEALLQNVDSILARVSPRTQKDKRDIEVARHNLKQIKKKYKREKAELHELREQTDE